MVRRVFALTLVAAALVVFWLAAQSATAAPPAQELKGDPTHGEYLFAAAEGCGCHMGEAGFLAGGAPFPLGPAGEVYARNITSDPETGIGNWSETEIVTAIRTGMTPDGRMLFPVMPYPIFTHMADQDAYDLAAFIKTAPPIKNAVPERKLNIPVPPFEPADAPATAPTEGVERGSYLVNAVAQCSDCHTPRDDQGNPIADKFLAGAPVETEVSANITPDMETGIGSWTEEQIAELLKTGKEPSGESVGGLMLQVIQEGFSHLTDTDRLAIAAYLKTIPAVNNVPQAAQQLPATGTNPLNVALLTGLVALGGVLFVSGALVWRSARKKQ
jgi:mono/diheme cytochrome c family protein